MIRCYVAARGERITVSAFSATTRNPAVLPFSLAVTESLEHGQPLNETMIHIDGFKEWEITIGDKMAAFIAFEPGERDLRVVHRRAGSFN